MFSPPGSTIAIEKKVRDDLKVVATQEKPKETTGGRCLSHSRSFMWALRL